MSAQEWKTLGIVLCISAVVLLVIVRLALNVWHRKKLQGN